MSLNQVLRRLVGSVIAIFLSSVTVFVLFFVMPGGDPAARIAGRQASPETVLAVRHSYGFDRPLYDQYITMMHNLMTNRLISYSTHAKILSEMWARFPATLSVAIGAIFLGALLTIASGMIGAIYRGRIPAALITTISLVIVSLPIVFIVAEIQRQISSRISLLPVGGYVSFETSTTGWLQHMILPWSVLSLAIFAFSGRLLTANLIDALSHPYVKTIRAKGASSRRIWLKHVLPNAILPIFTTLGLEFAGLIGGGSILVETLINIPGNGQYAASALSTLDLPVLIALTLVGSVVVITVNAIVDFMYPLIDPRARSSL
jgi:peptide/nickel transport system permease protein